LVEDDLVAAIDRGHLAGAWLDVCRSEPLPPASPLWRHPRITLTPHIAGLVLPRTASAQVIDNQRLVRAGAPPTNLVDPVRGY
jgi:glyoxylate/hydroxypyruvate reductase A